MDDAESDLGGTAVAAVRAQPGERQVDGVAIDRQLRIDLEDVDPGDDRCRCPVDTVIRREIADPALTTGGDVQATSGVDGGRGSSTRSAEQESG